MPRNFPAALLLPADAFDTAQHQLLGRRVAGRSFAEGIAQQLRAGEQLTLLITSVAERTLLKNILAPLLPAESQLLFRFGIPDDALITTGALHVPDPGLAKWVLLRSGHPSNAFSLTGLIHTLSSQSVYDSLVSLLTAPLEPWDALICTSRAGREVVQLAIDHHHEALQRRFGCSLPQPQGPCLPLIPLAVADSLPSTNLSRQELRSHARHLLGIPQEAYVILFVGRLSFHSKAHPLLLYRAMARLIQNAPNAFLLECGHIFNQSVADAFTQLQNSFPNIPRICLGGLNPASEDQKSQAFAAADVFVSPADNLQETFGLSVIEAMAAELPVVVSDWNGYRDLVINDHTGILIPTSMVKGSSQQLDSTDRSYLLGFLNYDNYVGLRSLEVVVDEDAFVHALLTLYRQPDLRSAWGANGRLRWQELFCWNVVAAQYRSLWDELAVLRLNSLNPQIRSSHAVPTAKLFSGYASNTFDHKILHRPANATPVNLLRQTTQQAFFGSLCGPKFDELLEFIQNHDCLTYQHLIDMGINAEKCMVVLSSLVKFGVMKP